MSSELSESTKELLQISASKRQSGGNEDTAKVDRGYLSGEEVLALIEESWVGSESTSARVGATRSIIRALLKGEAKDGYFVSLSGPRGLVEEAKANIQERKIELCADLMVQAIEDHQAAMYHDGSSSEAIENCFLELQRACSWNMTKALVAMSRAEGRAEMRRA